MKKRTHLLYFVGSALTWGLLVPVWVFHAVSARWGRVTAGSVVGIPIVLVIGLAVWGLHTHQAMLDAMTPEERGAYEAQAAERQAERELQALARAEAAERARIQKAKDREAAAEREKFADAGRRAERDRDFCEKGEFAWADTHPLVLAQVKSPSTADFVLAQEIAFRGGCTVQVRGWVDAQNAFGATIRATYLAEMTGDPRTRRWKGHLVSLD